MNPSPRWPLAVVALCAAGVLAALAWATLGVLSLESRERRAQSDAALEQSIRLALWRIDSALTPLIAREAARPYFQYQPFYPADRAYGAMLDEPHAGEPLVPSPLLQDSVPFVRLYFQRADQGPLASPQVPTGVQLALAEAASVAREKIHAADAELGRLGAILPSELISTPAEHTRSVPGDAFSGSVLGRASSAQDTLEENKAKKRANVAPEEVAQTPEHQALNDFGARQQALRRAIDPKNNSVQVAGRSPEVAPPSATSISPTTDLFDDPRAALAGAPPPAPIDGPRSDNRAEPESKGAPGESDNTGGAPTPGNENKPAADAPPEHRAQAAQEPPGHAIETRRTEVAAKLERERRSGLPSREASLRDAPASDGKSVGLAKDRETEAHTPDLNGKSDEPAGLRSVISIGELSPRWVVRDDDGSAQLILLRAVRIGDSQVVQGCWIDWPALRESLVADVRDLLPAARIEPIIEGSSPQPELLLARRLAAIPARIDPGPSPPLASPRWTPMRSALVLTWVAVLAALLGLASLVRTARDLAERRGRFVSAVTHELRTPLTTFVLYSQMLADGVVRDEGARSEYLGTLKGESLRLARIVENVLDYARLGRRPGAARIEPRPVPDLLASLLPELRRRAEQAGATLVVHDETKNGDGARIDPTSLSRALFNLVDNACKYATAADADGSPDPASTTISLSAALDRDQICFRVSDRGRGISAQDQRRLFKPFQRGASLDHASTSGLGLGLSLSRELARHAGGDVRLERTSESGTTFVLSLPLVRV